jgi:hypothetical protein
MRNYMEQLHTMFESATDAAEQVQFMQAVLAFTVAFLCSGEDNKIIDREATRYVTALINLVNLHKIDLAKKQSGRFDA